MEFMLSEEPAVGADEAAVLKADQVCLLGVQ